MSPAMANPFSYEGKRVVVTGAYSGVGAALVELLSELGAAHVTVLDVRKPSGPVDVYLETDLGDPAALDGAIAAIDGRVDVLFNNAGVAGTQPARTVMSVNYLALRRLSEALLDRIPAGGAIVNTASIAGLTGTPTMVGYGASKHAVVGITKTAARELAADGIRVNAICPGYVETRMMGSIEEGMSPNDPTKMKQRIASSVPLKRYATPEEIAAFVAYLCSPDASYITGGIFPIDGGRTA